MMTAMMLDTEQLQFIECWLPFVQDINALHHWGYSGPELETLILQAARDLSYVRSPLEARVILWHYHKTREKQTYDNKTHRWNPT